jgi:hypothetical protein
LRGVQTTDKIRNRPSGAKLAAEKLQVRDEIRKNIPRRLKPDIDLIRFSGTDKSVPFQNSRPLLSVSAAYKVQPG